MNLFQCKTKPNGVEMVRDFVEQGFIAIGWGKTDRLEGMDKEEIREQLAKHYDYQGQKLSTNLGTVNAFVNTMKPGDICLITEGDRVHIGKIGEYDHDPGREIHIRSVEWIGNVYRYDLNAEVQSLLRNQTSVTKFKHSIEKAELDRFLNAKDVLPSTKLTGPVGGRNVNALVEKALAVLLEELDNDDGERRVRAALEILRYLKK